MSSEHSRNHRNDERFTATLKVTYKSFERFITEYTKNVSKGGMFIRTDKPHPKDQLISLSLAVPGMPAPVEISCRVAHVQTGHDAGMGVQFIDINDESREKLIAYLRERENSAQ